MQIIHGLLRRGTIDFHGQYHDARDCELRPRGTRHRGPQILIGAGPGRPARFGSAPNTLIIGTSSAVNNVEKFAQVRNAVDTACVKAVRDPATLKRTVTVLIDLPGAEDRQISKGVRAFRSVRRPAAGTPEELAELRRAVARASVIHARPRAKSGHSNFAEPEDILTLR